MKTHTRTLIKSAMAIAVGAAFVAPAAFAQDIGGKVGGQVTGAAQAQVPDPVPAADRALEQSATTAQERMEQATDAAQMAQERVQDNAEAQAERAMDTAQDAQDRTTAQTEQTMEETGDTADDATDEVDEATAEAMQDAPPATPEQSQGAANAAAHSAVVERELFSRLDTDGDSTISDTEADADVEFDGSFSAIDSDGDGSVTSAEYDAYAKANLSTGGQNAADHSQAAVTTLWANFDADTDGRLSATEVEGDAGLSSSFETIDDDGDGFVTQDEYRAYARANVQPEDPTP